MLFDGVFLSKVPQNFPNLQDAYDYFIFGNS